MTAVDLSPAGVANVARVAVVEALPILAIVADIRNYVPEGPFDVVLIDRTLHMLERVDRMAVLARTRDNVAPGGWLVIPDETRNFGDFREVLAGSGTSWAVLNASKGLFVARKE